MLKHIAQFLDMARGGIRQCDRSLLPFARHCIQDAREARLDYHRRQLP